MSLGGRAHVSRQQGQGHIVRRNDDRDWLTPQEAGLKAGFSAAFMRQEIATQHLPAVWVPSRKGTRWGRWKIHRDHLRQYCERLGLTA